MLLYNVKTYFIPPYNNFLELGRTRYLTKNYSYSIFYIIMPCMKYFSIKTIIFSSSNLY